MPRITIPRTLLAATIAAATTLGIVASASSSGSSRPAGKVHVLQVHRDVGHDFIIDADHSATPAKPAPDSVLEDLEERLSRERDHALAATLGWLSEISSPSQLTSWK